MEYSFLTSIYRNTNVDEMKECVFSMLNQTLSPEQIVIVIDGEIESDLHDYVYGLKEAQPSLFAICPLEKNSGLGIALREGMKQCRNELIARIDTDDICVLDRCEKQVKFMVEHPEVGALGTNIAEFVDNRDNIVAYRNVPETHEEICKYMKKRCPLNHMTVMLRKSEVIKAGEYQHWHYNEDSYLWARMFLADCKFYNIQEILVYARVDVDTYRRRGGYKYYKSERDLFKFMKRNKIINGLEYFANKSIRFIIQVLMPNRLRQFVFVKFMRKRA